MITAVFIAAALGAFQLYESEDNICGVVAEVPIEGRWPTELALAMHDEGPVLVLASLDWSTQETSYPVSVRLNGQVYEGQASGGRSAGRGSITLALSPPFLDDFAQGDSMLVMRGDLVVAHISLRGSSAAVADLRRCEARASRLRAARLQREAAAAYIARDPFAGAPAASSPRPSVITNVSWARRPAPEFPERAASRGITRGSATLNCVVSASGAPTNCEVVSEDPPGSGMGQSALRAVRSARFSPETVDGVADGGRARFTVQLASE